MEKMFYENQMVLQDIHLAVKNFHVQNYDRALRLGSQILEKMEGLVREYVEHADEINQTGFAQIDLQQIQEMLLRILKTQQDRDYVLLADLYELELAAYIEAVQQALFQYVSEEDLQADAPYFIEFCTNGECTLAKEAEGRKFYFHSNDKPLLAAYELAESWYKQDKSQYIIFGFGLGYHAYFLGKIDETVEIIVYESDENVIALSEKYGVKEKFLKNPKHKLIYDRNQSKLWKGLSGMTDSGTFVIHYPSLQVMEASSIKIRLENYFIQYNSVENQMGMLIANFRENQKNVPDTVYQLSDSWKGKTAYIVAAGPSLDQNFHELKKVNKEHSMIIAVGTVFRKMVKEKIPIDYVVISDANLRVREQIRGIEDQQIPLLLLSTANYKFGEDYKGPKYLIYQEDFILAEEAAKKKNGFTCKVGGSVSTVALDLALKLGCRKIITLGLDLAYTNNYAHAKDTFRRNISDVKDLRVIEDIYGKEVYTNCSMDQYREWIERHIKNFSDVAFYNATEGGANIKGMKNVALKDMVK